MNLKNISTLNHSEMKRIMAGSGGSTGGPAPANCCVKKTGHSGTGPADYTCGYTKSEATQLAQMSGTSWCCG